jgi:hypothetical protein
MHNKFCNNVESIRVGFEEFKFGNDGSMIAHIGSKYFAANNFIGRRYKNEIQTMGWQKRWECCASIR